MKTALLLLASTVALASAVGIAACGGSSTTDDTKGTTDGEDTSNQFLAFASTFNGYHAWEKLVVDGPIETDLDAGSPHFNGPRTVYVKRGGPAEGAAFAKGSLIVKEVTATVGDSHVFAMVKRGASYNGTGAVGWEYFELEPVSPGSDEVTVKWRGVGPPDGENYAGAKEGGCNGCHGTAAAASDSVLVAGLKP